ncbi:MAG: hypothetical protein II198_01655 [Bacteroidaceae bacterium]|nr:hypothetical protein [Bacteroidaceae bacterium]
MTARERIQKEVEQWFLTEPVFFTVYCSHRLVMNANMQCPLRSGKGRIEYNPAIIEAMPDTILRDLMRVEIIRILLQHPYARQPMGCPSIVLQKASDMVISPAYNLAWANLARPEDFDLPTGQNYEWYAMRLNEQLEKLQQAQDDSKQQQERESEQQQGSKKKQGQGNSQGRQQGQYGGQSGQQGGNEQESEQQGQGNGELQQGQGRGQGEQPNEMAVHRDGDAPCKGNFGGQQGEESTEDNRQKTTDNSQGNEGDELTEDKSQQSTVDGQGNEGDELTKDNSQQSTVDGNEEDESHAKPTSGYTDLWEEDQFQARQITDIVKSSSSWGSLPGGLIELIKKTAEGKIDYRAVLRMFRASILSQKRRLTRMRPSRRFGFEQMGSRYDFTTRLLIAIDTSGSVGSEDLGRYLNVTTSFFKYGIQQIDVLMFDAKVQGKPLALTDAKKNIKELKVCGRGGTDFQAPVDYAVEHPEYDGLIIITDGCAPCPDTERLRTKLLWVIDNESGYKSIYENLRKTGRVCLLDR